MREIIHLNYGWRYSMDFKDAYVDGDFDDSGFQTVMLPHANIELPYNNFDEGLFQFISCYRKTVHIDKKAKDKRALLHFEGVMACAAVYLNGERVCEHKGGYTPFKCDITEHLKYGGDNVIAVMVDSTEREDIPPFGGAIDYLTYGGIYREVRLELLEELFIEDVFVKTGKVMSGEKTLDIELCLANTSGEGRELLLECSLLEDGKEVAAFAGEHVMVSGAGAKLNIKREVRGVELWDIDSPRLYSLLLKAVHRGEVLDEYSVRFGFREAEFRPEGFYLNGRRVKIRGLNRHQSYPYVGYAMPKSAQYGDAEILKNELGLNLVRLSHYPQSKHFLDRCDELGLLVFEELPGWQYIGGEEWRRVALLNVEEMILRDRNRPSVVLWGVRINESQDDDELYARTNELARSLDGTRQTGGVRNFEGSRLLEDVYTYNDFLHRGDNAALGRPRAVAGGKAPYLVTEHNGHMFPVKKFDNEERRVEHCLRHLRVLDAMYGNPDISGAIGWCAFDYNTHKDFGSGDMICYHGVMDMFRIPKEAAAAYLSQQDGTSVMEPASSMSLGEREAGRLDRVYVFTNCDYIRLCKNGVCIGNYYPDRRSFPNLPHPPVVITDLIGDLLEKNEGMDKRGADRIKSVLHAVVKYGDKALPLRYRLRMALLLLKYRIPYEKAVALYTTYITNWGCKSLKYEFEGYIGGRMVAAAVKSPCSEGRLLVLPDRDTLTEEETYDVCRVVLKHVNEYGNVLIFSNEVISLEAEGEGEIIGPDRIALIGGSRAFWLKSAGRRGRIRLTVRSGRFKPQVLEFKVEKR